MHYYRLKSWYYSNKLKVVAWAAWSRYKFRHWLFRWNVDDEGDIVFSIATVLHFIKYKEHTVIKFGRFNYTPAPKHVFDC